MTVVIRGLEDVLEAFRDLPSVLERSDAVADVARRFRAQMTAVTPAGYSGRLGRSVLAEFDQNEARVGYEEGVETAGNPRLDSVMRGRTSGRSVLWVSPADLGELLSQEFEDFEGEAMSVLENSYAGVIDGGS